MTDPASPATPDALDMEHLRTWIGRTERRTERIEPWPARALSATLGCDGSPPAEGDPLPPGWHWCHFLSASPPGELGRDGHPLRGGFLPPVPLPRRMWAGGRLAFHGGLRIGEPAERVSEIADVRRRDGRSGPLVFVTVRHSFHSTGRAPASGPALVPALVEEHDIVYRPDPPPAPPGAARAASARPAPDGAVWSRILTPDPVLLFRYSALTFNGHRIHYDRSYATGVEGYRGVVVHGPLVATLLLDLLRREQSGRSLRRFAFRAVGTLFDGEPVTLHGRPEGASGALLWATGPDGVLAMTATAEFGAEGVVAEP